MKAVIEKAVITGDIINSRKVESSIWIDDLREVLKKCGKERENWEIYRGDSFQLITDPFFAAELAFIIKSTIKQNKLLDVRMSIGIGQINYSSYKITESNGIAFINSGECFENLKKRTLGIKTPWEEFNKTFNIIFQLVSLFSDNWTITSSKIIKKALENPEANQSQLAAQLDMKNQSSISEALKRGGYEEIKSVIDFYKSEIVKLCSNYH